MADESTDKAVDGITPNGENAFTSPRLKIALVVKPELTAGDLEKWLDGFEVVFNRPNIVDRVKLFYGAVRAGILVHCTDKPKVATMADIDGRRAEWYGAQLAKIYNRYNTIDPN